MFQQEQQRLLLKKERFHEDRLQRLQEQEQKLQFAGQLLQKQQLLEVLELEEEAKRRITGAKIAEILLTDDLPESIEENELKDTLSQPSTDGKPRSRVPKGDRLDTQRFS